MRRSLEPLAWIALALLVGAAGFAAGLAGLYPRPAPNAITLSGPEGEGHLRFTFSVAEDMISGGVEALRAFATASAR